MTLKERIRAGVIITIALLAIGFVFLGNQRPAEALNIGDISGGSIDQGVFCFLDQFPTTDVFNTGCAPTPTSGSLTVVKIVSGTSTPAADFDIYVASSTPVANSPQPGDSSGTTFGDLTPGSYTVSEQVDAAGTAAGVTMSDFSAAFSGDCDSDGNVTVSNDANATCTITNTYIPPVVAPTTGGLVVDKIVDNTGGGTATANDFSFQINGGDAVTFNADGENDISGLAPGPYSVTEVATSTYTSSLADDCSGDITAGATSTCTITNTYIVPTPPPSCTIVSDTNTEDATDGTPAVLVTPLNAAWTATSTVAFDPSAAWIWSENPAINTTVNTTKDFTRTFDIVGAPVSGSIDIAADNGFVLTVNGNQVVDDSAVEDNYSSSQHFDITSDLVSGVNTVEADVTNFGVADSDGTSNPGGLIFQVNIPDNACTSGGGGGSSPSSDLEITKSVDNPTPVLGDEVTYTLVVTNDGPDATSTASATDLLPTGLTYVSDDSASSDTTYDSTTGLWTIGTLADEASATLHIVATVDADDTAGTGITNTATTSSDVAGTATVTPSATTPPTESDIAVTKTVDNSTPNIGDTVTYTITASDSGEDATGVVVQDILPSGLTFVSTTTADTVGVYDSTTGDWTIGTLSSATPAILHIMATVNSGQDNGTVITNTAEVTAGDTSDDSENNSSSASVTVTIPAPSNPTPSNSGGGGGGGGGNGPIAGSFGSGGGNGPIVAPQGEVLGASTSALACDQYLTAFIRSGADNDASQVTRLQQFLNQFEGDSLTVNGIYDTPTLNALEAFQAKYASDVLTPWGESAPTGYVYLTTRREVNEIYCHFTQNFPLTPTQQAEINAYRIGHTGGNGSGAPATPAITPNPTVNGQENENVLPASSSAPINPGESQTGAAAAGSPTGGFWSSIGGFFSHIF